VSSTSIEGTSFHNRVPCVLKLDELLEVLKPLREKQQVISTNGCFDILHVGHLRYLQACKKPGEILIVYVNSDASIRRLKGPTRPVVCEDDRSELLAGLGCVDYVVLFEEDTPEKLLEAIKPDFHAKGAQYTAETLPEMPLLNRLGVQVRFIEMVPGRSTSSIIERIEKSNSCS
jgi:rfaE bifunctional protein nucleotidyltransferase chain/domain